MSMITFTVEMSEDGRNAIIKLPDGRSQQVDANKIAEFTDKLSKQLGRVKERHIGDHHHHTGVSDHSHDHIHQGDK